MHNVENMLIPDVLRTHAAQDDGREFLRLVHLQEADEVYSYGELIERGESWTAAYVKMGLKLGARVIVILPHSVDLYAVYIGALLGGFVPAMFAFPSPKLSEEIYFQSIGALLKNAGAHVIVSYADLAKKLRDRAQEDIGDTIIVTPDDILKDPLGDRAPTLTMAADAIAFLQYSSGTTGIKKGVAVSHRALLTHIAAYAASIAANKNDKIVSWLPLYHDMGLITCFFLPLVMNIPLVAMSPFDWVRRPGMWLRAIDAHAGTLSWLPNFAFNFMADNISASESAGLDLSSLRSVVNCSEPIMDHSFIAFADRFSENGFTDSMLACSYAMAENTFAVTNSAVGRPPVRDTIDAAIFEADGKAVKTIAETGRTRTLVSSGRALRETHIRIVGLDGEALAERHVGEIVVSSPALMNAYYGAPELTAAVLHDRAYHTGDLGYLANGELFVTGRVQDLIIIGGKNIYPQDIEAATMQVEGVIAGRVAAVGVPREISGTQSLVVLAETHETEASALAKIKHAIFAAIAERTEVTPSDVHLAANKWLRKSTSGKISRKASMERYLALKAVENEGAPSQTMKDENGNLFATVRRCVEQEARRSHGSAAEGIDDETALLTSGLIDSFGLASLILSLEVACGVSIQDRMLNDLDGFDSIRKIVGTITAIQGNTHTMDENAVAPVGPETISMTDDAKQPLRRAVNFWTLIYRLLFTLRGIRFGEGLQVLGPLTLQIDGKAENIAIGRNVTLMPGVHLKVRENGRIILHDGVKLDTNVRLVAANNAKIELGERTVLGMGTCLNAGMDILIGKNSLVAAYCMLNVSDHGIAKGSPMREQPYEHSPIYIGADTWLGVHVFVSKGARIGNGAIVSAGSVATGIIPDDAIVQGNPARVIKFRTFKN